MTRRLWYGLIAGIGSLCLCSALIAALYLVYQRMRPTTSTPDTAVELSGHMVIGFETARFVPCGDSADPGDTEGYWISADPGVELYDAYHNATGEDYTPAFLHFRGRLSPPGEYGHLGGYTREVTVTEIIELNVTGTC